MFRRRNTRKPAEHLYSAFKQQYAQLNDPMLDALPATPFPPGPPLPAASISQADAEPSSSSAAITQDLEKESGIMSPRSYELPELESFDPPGHFLDPNHLDTTIGGGFAPSPGIGFNPASSNMAFSSTAALDMSAVHHFNPSTISAASQHSFFPYQSSLAAAHAAAANFDLGDAMTNYQHFPPQNFGNEPNFNPQQSLLHGSGQPSLVADPSFQNMQHMAFTHPPNHIIKQPTPALLTFAQKQQQQFRWHLTLRAHTAMIKSEEEIPMTYLNKRQPYTVFLSDTKPLATSVGALVQYRTSIRVCFDEDQQRSRPAACWQLFREGRGNQENDARGGGTLQAVEYVYPEQTALSSLRGNVALEKEDFDGFSFTWWPTSTGAAECSVQMRFNFLSTDFSHSKGVKGVPVRLCAKTEVITSGQLEADNFERSFCKIKLFRDHGAERKLANDRQHLSKKIEKFQKQLGEDELKENGKRRRSASIARPAKVIKHNRTWSMSSESSDFDNTAEGELRSQLRAMEAQFATQQDYSLFFLRGDEADDPDLHPVDLSDQPGPVLSLAHTATQNTTQSSNQSPTSSTRSIPPGLRKDSVFRMPTPMNASTSRHTSVNDTTPSSRPPSGHTLQRPANPQNLITPPEGVSKVQKISDDSNGESLDWIEAMDVDASYKPPPPRPDRAVACFYVKPTVHGVSVVDGYYRAIYLRARTYLEFVERVGRKCGIKPSSIQDVVRVTSDGLHVAVDDDTVLEMAEGQDMHADFDLADEDPVSFTEEDHEASLDRYVLKLRF